jgi:nicotinamidase-related amidase
MSILRNIFKKHQRSPEDWAALLEDHLHIGAGYLRQAFLAQQPMAHIAVDLQKGYCEPCLPLYRMTEDHKQYHYRTRETLARISEFSADLKKARISQFWLRHLASFTAGNLGNGIENYDPATHNAKLEAFIETANDICVPADPDRVISKRLYSGFNGTDLEARLHAENIKVVLISGGMRRACVQETAKDAANRHFLTFVVDDLTIAGTSLLTANERGIDAFGLANYNVYPVTSDQIRKVIGLHND